MSEYEVKQIIEYVNDMYVSDHYGKWGALTFMQRKTIRDLCNSWLIINEHDKQMTRENQELKAENNKLREYCRELRGVNLERAKKINKLIRGRE